ncbi:MAG: ABC transporter ATP-binding protein [Deltaproteobacteria bacterium]|nr:ABC transporter ATP-binding protein [Deltaproteobacteria bacterium]
MNNFIDLEAVNVKFKIYRNPTPSLKEWFLNRFSGNSNRDNVLEFYALNQINLKIEAGTRLGVLGLNGAGKSTLLKTIAGIYYPHQGKITISGRVTPLMELGAGFDAEQTGRENIYLNGSMLGFSPTEMKKRESAIEEFSELKDFLDLPVKYYSSGMYGRLAFSIATMTEPEILLIDEVFATGDAHFVEKSAKRILDLVERSQIVIIVTHNSQQIIKLCNRAIVLDKGRVVNDGNPIEMVNFYNQTLVNK